MKQALMAKITYPSPLPSESPKAYDAFRIFCELGADRSIATVGKQIQTRKRKTGLGRSSHIADWSREHRWQERVKEFDRSISELAQEKINQEFGETLTARLKNFDRCFDLQQQIGKRLLGLIWKLAMEIEEKDPDSSRKLIENIRGLSAAFSSCISGIDKTQMQWQNLMGLEQISEKLERLEKDKNAIPIGSHSEPRSLSPEQRAALYENQRRRLR
jgi:hypothetical protein